MGLIDRINVPVHPDVVEILQRTVVRDDCSLTEAVARLIVLGDLVATALNVDGHAVQIVDQETGAVRRILGLK